MSTEPRDLVENDWLTPTLDERFTLDPYESRTRWAACFEEFYFPDPAN